MLCFFVRNTINAKNAITSNCFHFRTKRLKFSFNELRLTTPRKKGNSRITKFTGLISTINPISRPIRIVFLIVCLLCHFIERKIKIDMSENE